MLNRDMSQFGINTGEFSSYNIRRFLIVIIINLYNIQFSCLSFNMRQYLEQLIFQTDHVCCYIHFLHSCIIHADEPEAIDWIQLGYLKKESIVKSERRYFFTIFF